MSLEWDKPECFQAAAPNRHPFLLFYHFPPFSSSINPMNPLQRKKRKKKLIEISRWRIQFVDASFHLFFEKEKLKKNLTQGRGIIIPDRTSIEKINKFHEIYLRSSNRRLSWTSWLSRSNLHGFLRGRIFHWKSRRAGNVVRGRGRKAAEGSISRLFRGCTRGACALQVGQKRRWQRRHRRTPSVAMKTQVGARQWKWTRFESKHESRNFSYVV